MENILAERGAETSRGEHLELGGGGGGGVRKFRGSWIHNCGVKINSQKCSTCPLPTSHKSCPL